MSLGQVLGPEREAFRLVYKRRLEDLASKLREPQVPAPDPPAKVELVNEISKLFQEREDLQLRREARPQLEAARRRADETRQRRDALQQQVSGLSLDSGEAERLEKKVKHLRSELQRLADCRQSLEEQLTSHLPGHEGQAELSAEVQASNYAQQVELKMLQKRLSNSRVALQEQKEHERHASVRLQNTYAAARKQATEKAAELKQQLQQEQDAADCLGEAVDRVEAQQAAASGRLARQTDALLALEEQLRAVQEEEQDLPLQERLGAVLQRLDQLKDQVRQSQRERQQLGRKAREELQGLGRKLDDWHARAERLAPRTLERVLKAFQEEIPCHSLDLVSLLACDDDTYVVPCITQLFQGEAARQASAVGASGASVCLAAAVERVQRLEKELLLETAACVSEDELRDIELQLALLVGRRDEALQGRLHQNGC